MEAMDDLPTSALASQNKEITLFESEVDVTKHGLPRSFLPLKIAYAQDGTHG